MLSRRQIFIALAATPLATRGAFAQGQAIAGIGTTTTYTVRGRITAADPAARTVTLAMDDGTTRTVKVSQSVANFGRTKAGDIVAVGLEEKREFVLSGPNTKTPGDRSANLTAVGTMGKTAGAVVADKSVTTWWVTAVDTAGNKISLVDPGGGQVRTFSVDNPAARTNLSRIKPGDSLTAISTDIAAVSLTPGS